MYLSWNDKYHHFGQHTCLLAKRRLHNRAKNPQLHSLALLLHSLLKSEFYGDLDIKIKAGEIVHITKAESIKL